MERNSDRWSSQRILLVVLGLSGYTPSMDKSVLGWANSAGTFFFIYPYISK